MALKHINKKKCFFCGRTEGLVTHHIFRSPYKKQSEYYGFLVWLCTYHHTASDEAVHNDREKELYLRRLCQRYYEKHYGTREDFIKDFGKNYL